MLPIPSAITTEAGALPLLYADNYEYLVQYLESCGAKPIPSEEVEEVEIECEHLVVMH